MLKKAAFGIGIESFAPNLARQEADDVPLDADAARGDYL